MAKNATKLQSENLRFRPRARLLLLLGDQLIRNAAIAVFELVKNAYDADSPYARVVMSKLTVPDKGKIIVEDSGTGMDYETVTQVWLEPGTDYRAEQRKAGKRTEIYGRLPIGEKGVGRFAAHKLGSEVTLITRRENKAEVIIQINWTRFDQEKYLDNVPVKIQERTPEIFTEGKTGTRIEINILRNVWTRGMVRELARSVISICSPFNREGDFHTEIILTDNSEWLKGLLTVEKALEYALFQATCRINGRKLTYHYQFTPLPAMDRVKPRQSVRDGDQAITLTNKRKEVIDTSEANIGPVDIDLYIFDREPRILALGVADKQGLKDFLDQSGGIRVYRDGIRVYDYGEPGNDWLNLGGARVNVPTRRISNNLVVGAVSISLDRSSDLIEKTNREGFVENEAYYLFKDAINAALTHIVAERNQDKVRIRNAYSSKQIKEPVIEDLSELREIVAKKKLANELNPYLDRIEADFVLIRDRFLTSASAGLSLTVVIHEVEKGIEELQKAVEQEQASPKIKSLAKHLADLVEGFASLIRRSGVSRERAGYLIERAVFNTELRLKLHKIELIVNVHNNDFNVRCSRRLVISTLMNLIDNSIWWLDNKWGDVSGKKQIYIGTSTDDFKNPAIIVADNGPGFIDPPEYLVEPFISRKPDGMGLGLHIADQVMKAQGGKLMFPESGGVTLPEAFDGAVVALVFQEDK